MKKLKPIRKLEKDLDYWLSKFIRNRDGGVCISCGSTGDFKEVDAGHYVKRQHKSTRWDERNVNCQCRRCNRYMGGNMDAYAIGLMRKHGDNILKELDNKKKEIFQPRREWLNEKIEYYKNLTKHL